MNLPYIKSSRHLLLLQTSLLQPFKICIREHNAHAQVNAGFNCDICHDHRDETLGPICQLARIVYGGVSTKTFLASNFSKFSYECWKFRSCAFCSSNRSQRCWCFHCIWKCWRSYICDVVLFVSLFVAMLCYGSKEMFGVSFRSSCYIAITINSNKYYHCQYHVDHQVENLYLEVSLASMFGWFRIWFYLLACILECTKPLYFVWVLDLDLAVVLHSNLDLVIDCCIHLIMNCTNYRGAWDDFEDHSSWFEQELKKKNSYSLSSYYDN